MEKAGLSLQNVPSPGRSALARLPLFCVAEDAASCFIRVYWALTAEVSSHRQEASSTTCLWTYSTTDCHLPALRMFAIKLHRHRPKYSCPMSRGIITEGSLVVKGPRSSVLSLDRRTGRLPPSAAGPVWIRWSDGTGNKVCQRYTNPAQLLNSLSKTHTRKKHQI